MPDQGGWWPRFVPVAVVLAATASACSPTPSSTAQDFHASAPAPAAAAQDAPTDALTPAATTQAASVGVHSSVQAVAAGKRIFQSTCSLCHSPQPGRNEIGPSLFGVVGRHSGQVPGFHYSEASRRSGLTWDLATLDRYLTNPRRVVPGTLMTFPGIHDPAQRADVIAYLATLH